MVRYSGGTVKRGAHGVRRGRYGERSEPDCRVFHSFGSDVSEGTGGVTSQIRKFYVPSVRGHPRNKTPYGDLGGPNASCTAGSARFSLICGSAGPEYAFRGPWDRQVSSTQTSASALGPPKFGIGSRFLRAPRPEKLESEGSGWVPSRSTSYPKYGGCDSGSDWA